MAKAIRKIINDPVYGFITIDEPLVFSIISHPFYQRLRRIHQMAFASLVYPGAVHTRLHHSLGAYHLICMALNELKSKGVAISKEEENATKAAILLHDIGHGPFSHALENKLVQGIDHETIGIRIMEHINNSLDGALRMAIDIFTNRHEKAFLHQLISGQLDVDRMDYLNRDSFFTGVSEGVIGYDRIIKMMTVVDGELMIEEKGIYSTEKFLVSRRLMYWQVYLHKTVLCAEKMLVRIIERARELIGRGQDAPAVSAALDFFLHNPRAATISDEQLKQFCLLDDYDVLSTIKNWSTHADPILSILCRGLVERRLLKVKLQGKPFDEIFIAEHRNRVCLELNIPEQDAQYLVFTGEAENTTYNPEEEKINIVFKDGSVKDISEVDNALIHHNLSSPVKKYYICYLDKR